MNRCTHCGSLLGGEYRIPTPVHLHVLINSLRGSEFKLLNAYISEASAQGAVVLTKGCSVNIRFTTGTLVWSEAAILEHYGRLRWSVGLGAQALEFASIALNHVLHYQPCMKQSSEVSSKIDP